MERVSSDFRKQIDDGQARGLGTGGLSAPPKENRGEGTGGLNAPTRENRGEGTGGLNAPTRENRGEGTGGLTKLLDDGQARGQGSGGLARKIDLGIGPSPAASDAPKPEAPIAREPPTLLRSLTVSAGKKPALRAQLEASLCALSAFALSFFDAIVTEIHSSAPTDDQPRAPTTSAPWESAGFRVLFDGNGSAVVSGVIGNSPAGRAGLLPLDTIEAIEDNGKPIGPDDLARGWNKGLKWSEHRIVIEREGRPLELHITKD